MNMRKVNVGLIVLLSLAVFSCNGIGANHKEGNIIISGNLENVNGKKLVLERFVNNQPEGVDTSEIDESGHFELAANADYVDFYRLKLAPQNQAILILTPGEDVEISGDGASLGSDLSVEGSDNTKLLWSYYAKTTEFSMNSQDLRSQVQSLQPDQNEEKQVIIDQFNALNNDFVAYSKKFIEDNSSSPAILSALGNLNIENDFDYYIIAKDGLKESFGQSTYYSSLEKQIDQFEMAKESEKMFDPGNVVPNITQNDPTGQPRSLYDLRGSVVLIDFWASWCRPCRAENPNVVRLYNKYHKDGFDIFSVSLDKAQDKWVDAIEADGLVWPNHVSDLQYWNSEAAQLYNVKSIPFTVLLDREGKVINIKLRGAGLEAKLKEIFGY
jgi:thiol-disulfide isomerase/thioredoxin